MENETRDEASMSNLNIREKSLLKRTINKQHSLNMRAGYVGVHEESLHKTGLRGRKSYAFWSLVGLVCLLAWSNTVLMLVVYRVLRMGHGMESLILAPHRTVIFRGDADLGDVFKPDGKIDGFKGEPSEIRGVRGPISIQIEDNRGFIRNALNVEYNGTEISGVNSFDIYDRLSKKSIFSTSEPSYQLPDEVRNLNSRTVVSSRITSSRIDKLVVKADAMAKLKGNEGAAMEAREINWTADQSLHLRSLNGTIELASTQGVIVGNIPVVTNTGHSLVGQYKVCICMPHGKLFKMSVSGNYGSRVSCDQVAQSIILNPCK